MHTGFHSQPITWVPPGQGKEEVVLVQNFLEHERAQLTRFVDWHSRLARVPIGGKFEEPVPVLLREAPLPLYSRRTLGASQVYVGVPISGRAVETEVLLFPGAGALPLDRPITLERVRRSALPPRRGSAQGEPALLVESWSPAGLREFLPPLPSSREAESRLGALLDEFPGARSTVEGAVRAFAGSPADGGSGAGLDSMMGAPGISQGTAIDAARVLAGLLPPWELTRLAPSRSRLWAGDSKRYPGFAAYRMVLDAVPSGQSMLGHPVGQDQSALLAGAVAGRNLLELLLGGDEPVLRSRTEVEALASAQPRPESIAPAVSLFIWAHGVEVTDGLPDETSSAAEKAIADISSGLRTLLVEAGMSSREVARQLEVSPVARRGLRRAALARARTQLRNFVEPGDFRAIAGSFSDSVAVITREGRPSDLRPYLVEADAALSAQERERHLAIQSDLLSHPKTTPEEIWSRLAPRDLWMDLRELEGYLDVLAARGFILVERGRTLSWLT